MIQDVPKTLVVLGINQRRMLVPLGEVQNAGLVEMVLMDWDTQEEHLMPLTPEQAELLQGFYLADAEAQEEYGEAAAGTDPVEEPRVSIANDPPQWEASSEEDIPQGAAAFLGTVPRF